MRSRLYVTKPNDDGADENARVLKTVKANYAPLGTINLFQAERRQTPADATRGSPSQSHHVRADGGLVDKHQPSRIKHTLLSYPAAARSRHICSLPFGCLQHFF